jgi:D-erythronate 2-dehydrogenase
MRILVTGAAGFLGRALLRNLAARPPDDRITALDMIVPSSEGDPPDQISWLSGAVDDCEVMEKAKLQDFDVVYHLVSVPGAIAEREPALGRRVNLDATLDLFDRLVASNRVPRVVYASSVAVYGDMDERAVGSYSPTRPTSTYGAHKRMAEIALADHSRRGGLSGIALRLPGLIARPGKATGFGSAFMSELPRAYAAAEPYVCPVSEQATAWWMSVSCAARNLARAARIDVCGELQLPALRLSVAEIVDALSDLFGADRRSLISFNPDARIESLFGRYPALATAKEAALGFAHDGTPTMLINEALAS